MTHTLTHMHTTAYHSLRLLLLLNTITIENRVHIWPIRRRQRCRCRPRRRRRWPGMAEIKTKTVKPELFNN